MRKEEKLEQQSLPFLLSDISIKKLPEE